MSVVEVAKLNEKAKVVEVIDKKKIDKSIYLNHYQLLSHNGLYNFSISLRGGGKTYNAKQIGVREFKDKKIRIKLNNKDLKEGIKNYIEIGQQFIYLRRYKTELKNLSTFFDQIRFEFPDDKLEVKGKVFYCNDEVCGYASTLSNAMTEKGISYEYVYLIIFDEFIIKKGQHLRYLTDEVDAFLNFYETVARDREGVRVIFLGNAISLINPYFMYWKISPSPNKRFNKYLYDEKGMPLIVVEINAKQNFIEHKQKSRFGQLVRGTSYEETNIMNKFADDNENFIEQVSKRSKHYFNVYYKGTMLGVWGDKVGGKYYVSKTYDKNSKNNYVLTKTDHTPNMMLIDNYRNSGGMRLLKVAFNHGYLFFEDIQIKDIMFDVLSLIGV